MKLANKCLIWEIPEKYAILSLTARGMVSVIIVEKFLHKFNGHDYSTTIFSFFS